MLFNVSLLLALAVLCAGLAWRTWTWLSGEVGSTGPGTGPLERLRALARGLGKNLAGAKGIAGLAGALFLDCLLQRRVFRESPWRWLAHQGVFWGFLLLILFHALESPISRNLLPDYYSTANPYALLRDLLGLVALLGLAGFARRRWSDPVVRRATGSGDVLVLVLLAVILLSGFGLKAVKITSQARFDEMVSENAGLEPGPSLDSLEAFWQDRYGVVFAGRTLSAAAAAITLGGKTHQEYCADCHSRPQGAFASWALSRALVAVAPLLDSSGARHWLWGVHFLACFLALALLPFGKLLHIAATPLSLLADAALGRAGVREPGPAGPLSPAARAARRALDLSACTRCAACSQHCSVLAVSRVVGGDLALPSQKLAAISGLDRAGGRELADLRLAADLCTRCQRCASICPAGIDLGDLWEALDESLEARGREPVYTATRAALVDNCKANGGETGRSLEVPGTSRAAGVLDLALQRGYFRYCFQCQTCTNVCPVVSCFEHPGRELGLLPHQIMYSLELGLVDQAMAAAMTWDCATCYQCQQHCPQGVPVTDLLYELRNQGFWLGGDRRPGQGKEGQRS